MFKDENLLSRELEGDLRGRCLGVNHEEATRCGKGTQSQLGGERSSGGFLGPPSCQSLGCWKEGWFREKLIMNTALSVTEHAHGNMSSEEDLITGFT